MCPLTLTKLPYVKLRAVLRTSAKVKRLLFRVRMDGFIITGILAVSGHGLGGILKGEQCSLSSRPHPPSRELYECIALSTSTKRPYTLEGAGSPVRVTGFGLARVGLSACVYVCVQGDSIDPPSCEFQLQVNIPPRVEHPFPEMCWVSAGLRWGVTEAEQGDLKHRVYDFQQP